jgi:23S rRNA (adenine2503-C2)-methyltransferase
VNVYAQTGKDDLAIVYLAKMGPKEDRLVEFVESIQPPYPLLEKWVFIVSTLYGCPIKCQICDAGNHYSGKLSAQEIFDQIDYMVDRRFPNRVIPVTKFKIQFARMGEPTFNPALIEVLEQMPHRYDAPGFLPSISTIGPKSIEKFLARLFAVKEKYYRGKFQMQFSIHTTDVALRDQLIPCKKIDFAEIARLGSAFFKPGDRKITLNFALTKGAPLDPQVLLSHFDPEIFLVKITPVNPTHTMKKFGLTSHFDPLKYQIDDEIVEGVKAAGYDVILSVGEAEENKIGSNCGQYVYRPGRAGDRLHDGYTYSINETNALVP